MIKSISKCMQILEIISNGTGKPVSLAKISELLKLPKPTCSHIISTLIEEGYIVKVSPKSGYILGPSTYNLSRYGKYNHNLIDISHSISSRLSKSTGYPVITAVIEGSKKYVIDLTKDDNNSYLCQKDNLSIFTDDIYRTATGRIIMAHMDTTHLKKIYDKYGPPKEIDQWENTESFESLIKELQRIKKLPYLKTKYRFNANNTLTVGYAMPIFEKYKCIGAIGIAAILKPEELTTFEKNENSLLKKLTEATKEINRRLDFNI